MINACRQIKEINSEIPILSTISINNRNIWKGLGISGEGIIFAEIDVDKSNPEYIKVNKRNEKIYGYQLNWVNIYGYTIGKYLSGILNENGNNKEKIRNALNKLNINSIRGSLLMNSNREVITPLIINKHENGENKPLFKN